MYADPLGELLRWSVSAALDLPGVPELMQGVVRRLHRLGIGVRRFNLTFRTLHPLFVAENWIWRHDRPEVHFNQFSWGSRQTPDFLASPLRPIVQGETRRVRHRIPPGPVQEFPLFAEFAPLGMTDYLALGLGPDPLPSVWLSVMTDQPGGFTEDQLLLLDGAMLALRPPLELYIARRVAQNLCATYLGPHTGPRVLEGAIRRGSVTELPAVVWFCDLREFTPISQGLGHQGVVDLLNTFFGAVGEAVEGHGGEILKFIGDAALVVFPLDQGRRAEEVCAAALAAAQGLLERLEQLPRAPGEPPLRAAVALHIGDVAYGNIGAPARLDFTVVGPAVNLASRLAGLAARLGEPLVASLDFARRCGLPLRALGEHPLKGFDTLQPAFGLHNPPQADRDRSAGVVPPGEPG